MTKTLLKNKEEFDDFVSSESGYTPLHGNIVVPSWFKPEKYPCVAVWDIEYDASGPDILDGEFVYLDDFKE